MWRTAGEVESDDMIKKVTEAKEKILKATKGNAGQIERRGLTVENERKKRGCMEAYVGTMTDCWGGGTCGA
jgi:hypothetical protein